MGSISHHITPLVINSPRGGHTHTRTNAYKHSQTESILEIRQAPGLKIHANRINISIMQQIMKNEVENMNGNKG